MSDLASDGSFEPWRVRLLGTFQVQRRGEAAAFRTKKTASLLAYLVFYRGRRISKELLVDTLWPEADIEKGRHSLRVALSSLRASFEAPDWDPARHIFSDRERIELSEHGFSTDVDQFRDAIRQAKESKNAGSRASFLTLATDLYAGQFLPGFGDEWILPQALELEEAFAQAACELIDLLSAERLADAVALGRRAISLCSNREDLHVALMRAFSSNGQPTQVLKQFEELERMLDDVWGEEPGDEALAILDALPKRTSSPRGEAPSVITSIRRESEVTRSAFFGRERELREIRAMLTDEARLVTLFGLGGSGKTRLSQQVGDSLAAIMPGRVWFVSLVGIEDSSQFHEAVLSATESSPAPGADVVASIAKSIGKGPGVLILDNLEQVVGVARSVINSLSALCPDLRILATSRIPLDAEGERLVPVTPLDLPSDYRDLPALRGNPSVQLLVEAAQSVRPGFAVTPANAQSVLLLCQRLEGIPLALELAAAKLGSLTPAQVIASIGRRVDLAGSRPNVREQHRSLRHVVEWSLGLLADEERQSFSQLGICRGGFNAGLAEALVGAKAEEHLHQLTRYSLVGWTETSQEVRFEMLETVREIAESILEADAERSRSAITNHFDFIHSLCLSGADVDNGEWVDRMQSDTGNVLVALENAARGLADPERAWELALPLETYVERTGRPQIWIAPLEALLKKTQGILKPLTAARANALLAFMVYGLRDIRATYDHYQSAIRFADETPDIDLRIDLRTNMVSSAITLGEYYAAQTALEEALALLEHTNDPKASALCYLNLAWLTFDWGREDDSLPMFEQALEHAKAGADKPTLAGAYIGLACAIGHQDYDRAQPVFDTAIRLWKDIKLPSRLAHSYYYRALIDYRHGKLSDAILNVERSFRLYVESGIALGQSSLTICANTLAAMGRHEDAAMSWGRADAARRRYSMLPIPCLQRDVDRETPGVIAALGPLAFERANERSLDLSDQTFVGLLFGD